MYLFFLFLFIFLSFSLIFLILLQPGKGLNNTIYSHVQNNIKFFNSIRTNNFITNIIAILSCLFLITSIVLCNISARKIEKDIFWQDNVKTIVKKKSLLNKKTLNSEIPH